MQARSHTTSNPLRLVLLAVLAPLALLAASAALAGDLATPALASPTIDDLALADARGGTETASDMKLNGVVGNNEAYNLSTGDNTIAGGTLDGASGIPTLIQNSGNNVLIQNATIVNVQVQ